MKNQNITSNYPKKITSNQKGINNKFKTISTLVTNSRSNNISNYNSEFDNKNKQRKNDLNIISKMIFDNNKINNTASTFSSGKEFLSSDINALNKNMIILNKIDSSNYIGNANDDKISAQKKRNFDILGKDKFERFNGSKEKINPTGINSKHKRNLIGVNHNNLSNNNSSLNANSVGPSNEIIFEDEIIEDKGTGLYSYFHSNPKDGDSTKRLNQNVAMNSISGVRKSNKIGPSSTSKKRTNPNIGASNSQEKMLTLNLKINKYINEIKTNKEGNTTTLTGAGLISTKNSNKNFPNLRSILNSISPKNKVTSTKISTTNSNIKISNLKLNQNVDPLTNVNSNKTGLENLISDEQRYEFKNILGNRKLSYGKEEFDEYEEEQNNLIDQDNLDLNHNPSNPDLNQIQTQFSTSMKITAQNLSDRIFPEFFTSSKNQFMNKNTERQELVSKKLIKAKTNIHPNKVINSTTGPVSLIQPFNQFSGSKVNYYYSSPKNQKKPLSRPLSNIYKGNNNTNIISSNSKYNRLQSALLSNSKTHYDQGLLSSNRKNKTANTISKTLSNYDSNKINPSSNIKGKYSQTNTISSNRLTNAYGKNIFEDRANTHSTHSNSNHIRKNNSFINNLSVNEKKNWIDNNIKSNSKEQNNKISEVYSFIKGTQKQFNFDKLHEKFQNENNTIDYGSTELDLNTQNISGIKRSLLERINKSQNKMNNNDNNRRSIQISSLSKNNSIKENEQNNSLLNLRVKNLISGENAEIADESNNMNNNSKEEYLNKENKKDNNSNNSQKHQVNKLSNSLILSSDNTQKTMFSKPILIAIRILNCYNINEKEVGLTEIDFFDKKGQKIEVVDASISSKSSDPSNKENTILNLFNGKCFTINEFDMFKEKFYGNMMLNINIENDNLGSIVIWNYNGSNTGIGVKDIEIYKKNICIWKGKINRGCFNCKVDYSSKIKITDYKSEDFNMNQHKTTSIKNITYQNFLKDGNTTFKKGYNNSISSLNSARNQIGLGLNYFTNTIDDSNRPDIKRNNSINIKKSRKSKKILDDNVQSYSYEKNILRTSIGKNSIDVIKVNHYDNYTYDENENNENIEGTEEIVEQFNNNESNNVNVDLNQNSFCNLQEVPNHSENSFLDLNTIDYSNYSGSIITCTKIKMEFTSNYGHRKYIGLTGIQFIDDKGCLINIEEVASTIGALPKDLRSYYNKEDDQRIFENTFNNINLTNDDRFMWLTLIKDNEPLPYFEITMKNPIKIKMIKIYNYNHSNDLDKCVKTLELYFDDHLNEPYKKTIILHKGVGESNVDYSQEITFPYEQKEITQEELEPYLQVKKASMLYYQHYETPYLPFGFVFKFSFVSNFGNKEKIGLEKIDLYDQLGRDILNPKYKNQYKIVYNNGITVFQSGKGKGKYNEPFLMDHVGYGVCDDEFDENLSGVNCISNIYFIFKFPVSISHMKIHNYKDDVTIGVKEIKIFQDGNVVFEGILNQGGPFANINIKDPKRSNITLILFTCDSKITCGIDESLLSKNKNRGQYEDIQTETSRCYTLTNLN